jgi:DNA polymerase III subunit epsilon
VVSGGGTPWREARFVAVDLETTGLDARRDEVLAFAAVPIDGGRIDAGGTVTGLVRPVAPPPPRSIEIHGLRVADLAEAPSAPEALAPLVAALDGRVPVAHTASVERRFLRPRLRALGSAFPRRVVDTALLWRALCIARGEGDPGLRSLSEVAARLGLPAHRPHVAEGDALTTAQAFLALATHLEGSRRVTVRALTRADWAVRTYRLWNPPVRSG